MKSHPWEGLPPQQTIYDFPAPKRNGHDAGAAEIARLAALPLLDYERQREMAAELLGCRVSILDRLIEKERGNHDAAPGQGRALKLHIPEPWPEPVDGDVLVDGLTAAIRRYVILTEHEARAIALWIVGAHAFAAWAIFPRLLITAPEKGCGKSTLLDVLSRLVPKPLCASNITAAALFRVIEAASPTLLLDEADAYCQDNEDLRSILDAGHRHDGAVIRTVGDDYEPRQFSAWAPVAIAAIGRLPGTIEGRSIIIRLRRRRADEPIQSFRLDRAPDLDRLARMAARRADDHAAALQAADPMIPAGIYNRAADNWRPLFAVATCAEGDWTERAALAAMELMGERDEGESARVLLLGDLCELFNSETSGVLFTAEIVTALAARDDRPWPEWKAGKPISGRQLAAVVARGRGVPRPENIAGVITKEHVADSVAASIQIYPT